MDKFVMVLAGLAIGTLAACAGMSSSRSDAGWITLLDGAKGLENWERIGAANWRAADGVVQADTGEKGKSSFLVTKTPYRDFMLRVEFWVSDDANSGIYMRCTDLANITDKTCYEANIFDQRSDPKYGTGAIVHLSPIANLPKAGGKWNTYEITARGKRLVVVHNGTKTVDIEDAKFASGPIALQWGRGTIEFRKVEITPL